MTPKPLPDQDQRDRIVDDLDTSMLVEAAAGTGKTTSMVDRMVALLASGRCPVQNLAAITFTRKAAAEMRERFQVKLEKEARESSGEEGERLAEASRNVGRAYIGTIHSFCARLLRERPVEARVPMSFRELDEDEEARLQREAWEQHCARLYAREDQAVDELARLGVELADLRSAFADYALYPDVDEWPSEPELPLPEPEEIAGEVKDYLEHIRSLPDPERTGTDYVLNVYESLPRRWRLTDPTNLMSLAGLLGDFDKEDPTTRKTLWPGEGREEKDELREAELHRWESFHRDVVGPFFKALHQHRYRAILDVLEEARQDYYRRREENGALNFQDLLLKSARLLREGGEHVRRYFQRRFSHLLVDEFQDTDPVQAEVMMLLTADNPAETDWRKCRPRPGSLFVVGDPKQSIYRFRRADLVTYNEVRRLIRENGGTEVELSANFRSTRPVIRWVNEAFNPQFPDRRNDYSPPYVDLEPGRDIAPPECDTSVQVLRCPAPVKKQSEIAGLEAGQIARYIRHALDDPMPIRPPSDGGEERPVRPEDFLIITQTKRRMSLYARALQGLGIPNQVTGGTVLNEVAALEQLHLCLSAVARPHNPVALVAVLRSELFGVSDPALYAFKQAGGTFDYRKGVPEGLPEEHREEIEPPLEALQRYSRWLALLPPVAAARKVAGDLGLPALAGAAPGGNVEAGSLQKAFELLRAAQAENWTAAEMVDYLGELAESEEQHDGLPAVTMKRKPVRIMNLHKAKGLQAPIVFLADPSGKYHGAPDKHIDRSGDLTRGYMSLSRRVSRWHSETIAVPPGWEEAMAEEKRFAEAEDVRLRYVAATRAGVRLVISQRAKPSGKNPWKPLAPYLQDKPELEEPGGCEPPPEDHTPVTPAECAEASESIEATWRQALEPTYATAGAKERVVTGGEEFTGTPHGTRWGQAIHLILESCMDEPDPALEALARSAIRSEDLPEEMAEEAVQAARSVTESEIWHRALSSERCLTEVPFRRLIEGEDLPLISRGVIDLAFREADGWIIVDYKTDDTEVNDIGALTTHYAPQLRAYREAWEECAGEEVKETAIYFTHCSSYVPVDAM